MKRDFKGVWIPKEIWLEKNLTLQEKCFFVEIDSLDNEDGCFASNQHFAEHFGISTVRVSEVINALVRKGYITSEIDQANGNRRILHSLLKVSLRGVIKESLRPSQRKVEDPIKDSFIHNNTINNTDNIYGRPAGFQRTQLPLNTSSLKVNIWLDAVAVACGAKDRRALPKVRKWETVCQTAIREDRDLHKLLQIIEAEKLRNKGQEEFFSPDTCLQKLQMSGKEAKQDKWMHAV